MRANQLINLMRDRGYRHTYNVVGEVERMSFTHPTLDPVTVDVPVGSAADVREAAFDAAFAALSS
jgi:hypothetical protein